MMSRSSTRYILHRLRASLHPHNIQILNDLTPYKYSTPTYTYQALSHQRRASEVPSQHPSNTQLTSPDMAVGTNTVLHIVQILGVFFCAHHLWPKGVTYGKQEDWEKSYRKRHAHGSSKSKSKSGRRNSSNENARRSGGGRSERSYYEERPRENEQRPRQYEANEYEDRPRHARQASSRY